ncbi:hypothetical protein D5086_001690 [Populus alba]|uniref:Uncharacterized protein n=1 Tax=Populus alba TaxID=43335 RepID=A0ACC4CZM6_POPAL
MSDLPREKGKSGLIIMGDLPKWKNGLIVMGDLPRRTRNEVGLENALPEWWWLKGALEMRVRKRTTRMVVAQRRTRKEVGLENALPEKWWLKGALGMRFGDEAM